MRCTFTSKGLNKSIWWETLDTNDPYLIKIFSGMFGSFEQRLEQLYIIKNTMNFKLK
jgi:hypothetical protein